MQSWSDFYVKNIKCAADKKGKKKMTTLAAPLMVYSRSSGMGAGLV